MKHQLSMLPTVMITYVALLFGCQSVMVMVLALRITILDVPSLLRLGEPTQLNCSYTLDHDEHVYSVKWYKGKTEIYAYLPSEVPPVKTFHEAGVYINDSASLIYEHGSNLSLIYSDVSTEGRYRCEVSIEHTFKTEKAEKVIIIYDIPPTGPIISGLKTVEATLAAADATTAATKTTTTTTTTTRVGYGEGEVVRASCSYGPSRPDATLEWYINHMAVSHDNENRELIEKTDVHDDGRSTSTLRLAFNTTNNHFIGSKGFLRLSCVARLSIAYNISGEELVLRYERRDRSFNVTWAGPQVTPTSFGPQIEANPDKSRLKRNAMLTLTCWSRSGPLQSLQWYRNDKEVDAQLVEQQLRVDDQRDGHGNRRLLDVSVKNVQLSDELLLGKGETRFRCEATYVFHVEKTSAIILSRSTTPKSGFHISSSHSTTGHRTSAITVTLWIGIFFLSTAMRL